MILNCCLNVDCENYSFDKNLVLMQKQCLAQKIAKVYFIFLCDCEQPRIYIKALFNSLLWCSHTYRG